MTAGSEVFINARLLRNEDGMVLASSGLVLPYDGTIATLLEDERVPVPASPAGRTVRLRTLSVQ